MNAKKRVRAAIEHRPADRVAIDFYARQEVYDALRRRWGLADNPAVEERLGADLRFVGPRFIPPALPLAYADPSVEARPAGVYRDIWGVGFVPNITAHGRYMDLADNPLKDARTVADLERHRWPSPDWWDYSHVAADAAVAADHWVWAHSRGIFEISWFLRGFEGFLLDLACQPDFAAAVMDRVEAYLTERTRRILAAAGGAIDMIEYNDDVGGQHGPLVSPAMWREHLKPRMASFIGLCRRFGVKVRYHSCGGIRPILEDLIEIGIDVLNPVQVLAAGMAPEGLARDFGGRITFNGGVDTQELLPRATAEEVRRQTLRLIETLGRDGGLILGPTHVFQADVPVENVLAVYEAALGRSF